MSVDVNITGYNWISHGVAAEFLNACVDCNCKFTKYIAV